MIDKENKIFEESLWESEKRYEMKRRLENVLRMYMLIGGIVTVIGVAYFVLSTLDIDFSKPQQIALLIAGVGFGVTVASFVIILIRKERRIYDAEIKSSLDSASEFLRYWAMFENVSKDVLQSENRKYNIHSLRETIEVLYKEGKIDESDLIALEEAIQVRNSLVHKGDTISPERARKYIKMLTDIIQKVIP